MSTLTAELVRALGSLDGLSVGDAFGQLFFEPQRIARIPERAVPASPWFWTDDTEMALSLVEELAERGHIEPDSLARRFVRRGNPSRGYGGGAIQWLRDVARRTPPGPTREGIERAADLDPRFPGDAARILGTGSRVSSADTVPWALFCAAHHLDDYEEALWTAVAGLGDRDTTCAIAGGIVALTAPIPIAWLHARETLPALWLG